MTSEPTYVPINYMIIRFDRWGGLMRGRRGCNFLQKALADKLLLDQLVPRISVYVFPVVADSGIGKPGRQRRTGFCKIYADQVYGRS